MKKKAIPCHKAGRITSFFLLISIFLLIPSITTPVYAVETYTQQTVFTLHATNKTVKEVFEYIEKNSEFVVLYSKDLLPVLQKKVSVSIDKQNVESILNILSKEAGLKYNINNYQSYGRSTSTGKKSKSPVKFLTKTEKGFREQIS